MSDAKSGWLGLSGRVCVVTGAGGGIGRAIVLGFAAEGAKVLALDLSADHVAETANLARAAGGTVVPMVADASREADIEAAATQCDTSFGGCDILVNNAGLLRPGGLDTLTAAEWNRLIEVNLTGYFLHAQIFGRRMLSAGRGRSSMWRRSPVASRRIFPAPTASARPGCACCPSNSPPNGGRAVCAPMW